MGAAASRAEASRLTPLQSEPTVFPSATGTGEFWLRALQGKTAAVTLTYVRCGCRNSTPRYRHCPDLRRADFAGHWQHRAHAPRGSLAELRRP